MFDFLTHLFDTAGFPARWNCGDWTPGHGWLHILSDLAIWSAYFAIPCILVYFVLRRRDIPFPNIFWLFGAFILACGTTHLMEAIIFWHPLYRLAGLIKLFTALVSWGTVAALVPIIPKALSMRTPDELEREIAGRKQAEDALYRANAELETRVRERTAQLAAANASLRYEREMLRITLASIGDGVMVTDLKGGITFLNSVAQTLTGWKEEDARGKPLETVFRIINEQTRKTVENPAMRALKEGTIVGLANHTILIGKDGAERGIDDSAAPIRDEKGNLAGVVLVFRDVTEQRKAQQSARFLASIVESSDDAIIGKDVNGTITSWNQGAERVFGYTATEVIGQPIAILAPPDRADEMPDILNRIRGGERVDHFDTVRHSKDGRLVPISLTVSPIRDEYGEIAGASKIARDISERKRAEEALRNEKERLHATLTGIGDAVIVTDAESRVTIMNPVAQALTGWKEEANGRPLEEVFRIVNELTRQPVESPVIRVVREGTIVGLANHTVLISKDGSARPIDDSAAPIRDQNGRILGVVMVFRDVTSRRQIEAERERLREELAAKLQELQTIFELAPVQIWFGDAECKRFHGNRRAYEEHGFEYGINASFDAAIPELPAGLRIVADGRELKTAEMPMQLAAHTGKAVRDFEHDVVHADGRRITMVADVAPLLDASGKVRGVVGCYADVTERKRVEAALRESEERLAAELEALSRLHAVSTRLLSATHLSTALDDVLESAIRTTEAHFGNIQLYDPQVRALEIVAQRGFEQDFLDYFRLVRVDDGSACAQAMQSGERIIIEDVDLDSGFEPHRHAAVAAGFRAVQSTPLKSRAGRVLGMLSTHFRTPHRPSERDQRMLDLYARHAADLIERIRFEEALRQSEAQFRQLADAMPQIVWTARSDGYLDYYNERWYEYTGFPRNVYGQESWQPILHPDDVQQCLDTYFGCIRAGTPYRIEYRFKDRSTGGYRWFLGRAVPVRDEQDRIVRWFGTCTDIDDIKRAEEALKDADQRKDEFLATLAHELRNPLAPLRNALEFLRRADARAVPFIEEARSMMERQVEQMVRLVDDLLDISRITRGKLQVRKELIALADVINAVIETARPIIEGSAHELSVTMRPEPIHMQADRVRLAQVFLNLLSNAAKYTEKAGHIWLTVERRGDAAVVSVRDTGIGIDAEHLPHIFGMFSQVASALERSQGGLGIGLALVKGLVELHGGTIDARSPGLGQGSEFTVRLPIADVASAEASRLATPSGTEATRLATPVADASRLAKYRILVVDDMHDAADSLAIMLRMMGHDVRTAYDGLEGVQTAAAFNPQVVLLDIGLPTMNGYEAARRIRNEPWGRGVALVALTGWGQDEDRRMSLEAGFDHHLTKPVDPAALDKLLRGIMPRQESVDSKY